MALGIFDGAAYGGTPLGIFMGVSGGTPSGILLGSSGGKEIEVPGEDVLVGDWSAEGAVNAAINGRESELL